jgi:hypothetical protein
LSLRTAQTPYSKVRFHASETKLIRCGGEATLSPGFPPVRGFAVHVPAGRKSSAAIIRSLLATDGTKGAIRPERAALLTLADVAI